MFSSLRKITHFRPALRSLAAATLLLALTACHKATPDELLNDAGQMLKENDVLSAQLKLEDLLKNYPDAPEAVQAHMGLARCALADRDFEKARTEFAAVTKATGGVKSFAGFSAEMQRIATYMDEKKTKEALAEALKTSESLRGAPPEALLAFRTNMSQIYEANGQTTMSIATVRDLLREPKIMETDAMGLMDKLGALYASQKDYASAAAVSTHYIDTHPTTTLKGILLFAQGAYEKEGKLPGANETLAKSEAQFEKEAAAALGVKDKARILMQLANAQVFEEKPEEARKTITRMLDKEKFPGVEERVNAQRFLVRLELSVKNSKGAIEVLRQVAQENPNSNISQSANVTIQQIEAQTSATLKNAAGTTGTLATQAAPAAGDAATTTAAAAH